MAKNTIYFQHPVTGNRREAPIGFSWTTFFFCLFPALVRGDWKWVIIMLLLVIPTFGLSWVVFPFIYNRLYIKDLVNEGYRVKAVRVGDITLAQAQVGLPLEQLSLASGKNTVEEARATEAGSLANQGVVSANVFYLIGTVVVGMLFLYGLFTTNTSDKKAKGVHDNAPPPPSTEKSDKVSQDLTKQLPNQASQEAELPEDETEFISALENGYNGYLAAPNELVQGGTRASRKEDICKTLNSDLISNWVGEVKKLDSTSNGEGILIVSLPGSRAKVKNGTNIKDLDVRGAYISPDSELFNKVASLRIGQKIIFSGKFYSNKVDCVWGTSFTLKGSMEEPEFMFNFTDVSVMS